MDQDTLKWRSHLALVHNVMSAGESVLKVTCPSCGGESNLTVETKPLEIWLTSRVLIQEVLPDLSNFQREQLITGYCQPCWDTMWQGIDDAEVLP